MLKFKEGIFPCEIKYQNKISREDYKGLFYFNKGLLLTKDFLNLGEKYSAAPAHLILALV